MDNFTGLKTSNGIPIYTYESVEEQRKKFAAKKSRNFIAQMGGQEDTLKVDADIVITGGNRGGGKANSYETDVIVPSGTVKMGKLKVGDPICTPYEGIQEVKAIYEQGEQRGYRFYFDDGTSTEVMRSHRFMARFEPDEPFREMEADEIIGRYRLGMEFPNGLRRKIKYYAELPLCGEVKLKERVTEFDLPMHPYVLGVITANGSVKYGYGWAHVPGFNPEAENIVKSLGYWWTYDKLKKNNEIRGITNEQRIATFGGGFRFVNYRIPDIYKYASISARWQYVRGVFDICGTTKRNVPLIKSFNRMWLEDLAWIIRSLGGWAKYVKGQDLELHLLYIKMPDDRDLAATNSRKSWFFEWRKKATSDLLGDISTKKIIYIKKTQDLKKFRCIEVSGKDHLYLTDGFTVNHNTVTLLMNPLYYVNNHHFNGIILRKVKDDLDNIVRESNNLYSKKGEYKSSYMKWDFRSGAQLLFSYFVGSFEDFKDRMQGRQYAYIGLDEITQIEWEKFKYLITSNRNGAHLRNRFVGTCNPDPTSWVRKFIDWWIGDDGYPIPERNGVVRYCYMGGDGPDDVVWGSTRRECYEKVRDKIDPLVDERDAYSPEYMYIKSVVFVRAELDDNRALLDSSPEYKANLAQQSDEQRERDFKGNWNYMAMGTDLIKMFHLEKCFENPQMLGDKVRRASLDVAFEGGDSCVMWLWIGFHVADVFVGKLDSKLTVTAIKTKLEEWRVLEENLIYDLQGIGQVIRGFFKKAIPFSNQEAVDAKYKGMYDTKKSQCAFMFADKIIQGEISFEPSLLERVFKVKTSASAKSFVSMTLREILMQERKIIRQDEKKIDKGKCLISKDHMKKSEVLGRSPDFIESLFMRMLPEIKGGAVSIPSWLTKKTPYSSRFHVKRLT